MPALELGWLRWLLVTSVIGLALTLFLYLGFSVSARRRTVEEQEQFPAEIAVSRNRIPPVLLVCYATLLIYLVAYTLYVWLVPVSY